MNDIADKVNVLAPHRREVDAARKSVEFGRRVTLISGAMERRERELAAAEARLAAVAELIEVNYKISNWLACAPICTPEDMAQSFGEMSALLDAALARVGGAL